VIEPTPYMRGVADACAGKKGPAFPTPDSSWAERLYARGWSDAMDDIISRMGVSLPSTQEKSP